MTLLAPDAALANSVAALARLQVPNPELGPLEQRVSATYEEALFTEEISPADTQYWFTEPQGAWLEKRVCTTQPKHRYPVKCG